MKAVEIYNIEQVLADQVLLSGADVVKFVDEYLPEWWDVQVVPYSAEDVMAKPRVLLSRLSSCCSLELPMTGEDCLRFASYLVAFGSDSEELE